MSVPHIIHRPVFLSKDEIRYLIALMEELGRHPMRDRIKEELVNSLQPISQVVKDRLGVD